MQARYADGRAAIYHEATCDLGAESLSFDAAGARHVWSYPELRRADDDNGTIMLKRMPDTGERLMLDENTRAALRAAAPALFTPRAQGVESTALVGGLAGAAVSLAAAFLVGVPMAAEPIARVMPAHYQEQIGEIARAQVEGMTEYCTSGEGQLALHEMIQNFVARSPSREDDALADSVEVQLVRAPFPNAFALPDNSIVVTDQLIAAAESPDEIAGVLAHELAHVSRHHVMANVIRNIGAGVFFDIVFGGAGAGQAVAIASVNLASLRYSRDDEAEADAVALDYLDAAGIDPGALARFFDRVAQITGEQAGQYPTLLSSHPATAERASAARARSHAGRPALSAEEWSYVRNACGEPEPEAQAAPAGPAAKPETPAAPPPAKKPS